MSNATTNEILYSCPIGRRRNTGILIAENRVIFTGRACSPKGGRKL